MARRKPPQLVLAKQCCNACLTTRNRIVSGDRAAQIIRDCRQERTHFFCHKGDAHTIHCRGVHEILLRDGPGSQAFQMASLIGVPIVEVDADNE